MALKILAFLCAFTILSSMTAAAVELPEWNIDQWCEKAAESAEADSEARARYKNACLEKEMAAKERLAKMTDAQELINLLSQG